MKNSESTLPQSNQDLRAKHPELARPELARALFAQADPRFGLRRPIGSWACREKCAASRSWFVGRQDERGYLANVHPHPPRVQVADIFGIGCWPFASTVVLNRQRSVQPIAFPRQSPPRCHFFDRDASPMSPCAPHGSSIARLPLLPRGLGRFSRPLSPRVLHVTLSGDCQLLKMRDEPAKRKPKIRMSAFTLSAFALWRTPLRGSGGRSFASLMTRPASFWWGNLGARASLGSFGLRC